MGTQTLGNTAIGNSGQFWFFTDANMAIRGNDSLTAPQELYIDSIHVFGATKDGASASAAGGLYDTAENLLSVSSAFTLGTSVQYYTASWAAGAFVHLASGAVFRGALVTTGQGLQVWGRNDGGTWNFLTNQNVLPSNFLGTTQTGLGNWPWYVTYFPAATVTAIPSTPQFPGATITVNGLSFTAGVTAVKLNGVACSSVSVTNDTTLTCVLPANASTGVIEVDTHAGNATSSGTLVIAGGRIVKGGVLTNATQVRVVKGGVLTPVTAIRVQNGGTLKNAH